MESFRAIAAHLAANIPFHSVRSLRFACWGDRAEIVALKCVWEGCFLSVHLLGLLYSFLEFSPLFFQTLLSRSLGY